MKTMKPWIAASVLLTWCGVLGAAEHAELKAYPPTMNGLVRQVIVLPHKERGEEDAFQVELIVGRKMMTDGVNTYFLGGEIEEKTVEGWGYPYYLVRVGEAGSTLMAPLADVPPVERFVAMPSKLIRYNSRLPVVVYTPKDVEVRYRIWSAGDKTQSANKQ